MSIGHRIGRNLRALVQQNAGVSLVSHPGISVAIFKLENGGKDGGEWTSFSRNPSEEARQEPWMKAAMDTLNRELWRQGTRIRGKPVDPSLIPPSPAAEYENIFEDYFLPCSHAVNGEILKIGG